MKLHDLESGHLGRCQICGSKSVVDVVDLGHQAPCDSLRWPEDLKTRETTYPLNLVRCRSCGLVQIDYVVDADELFFPKYPYLSGITSSLAKNLQATANAVAKRFQLEQSDLVVDLGSNDGSLLKGFREMGMEVLGVEPTNVAAKAIALGIPTIQKFFSEEVAEEVLRDFGKPRVVTAANMFAHVSRLGSLIRGVEMLLDEGSLFVTESHYLMDLVDSVQYDSIYHEHLKYYSLHSIMSLFSYYDFSVVDVERIPNYGGSIRVYAVKGKNHLVKDSVTNLLEDEVKSGLLEDQIYSLFSDRVRRSRIELQQIVFDAAWSGKSVVGIGSPGRASTLLSYCKFDSDTIDYVAEQSSSLKVGLFTPGTHIKIVDERVMFENPPDLALLLSWHYATPILASLRQKGLTAPVLVPLPEPKVHNLTRI